MLKDTKSLGNNKAPACESRGFVRKKQKVCILTHLHAATVERLGTIFHIPVADEVEKVKGIVGAPEDCEFTSLLMVGYSAENAFLPEQKESMSRREYIRTSDNAIK